MENASKALIIAGAVLVAIVLISIGIYIVSSTKPVTDVVNEAGVKLAVQTYNSTFTKYVGTQKGSTVKNLLSDVITNNHRNTDKQIVVTRSGESAKIEELQSIISSAKNYKISIPDNGYDSGGYVVKINIADA